MFRIAIVSGITLFSFAAANAGQIQIGGANGLTSSTVSGCSTTTCSEQGYISALFPALVTPPVGPGTITDNAGDGGSGVVFSEINDTGNFWDIPSGSTASILTVPIGLYAVTDVWTMLNDIQSTSTRDVTVIFNFGNSANVTGQSVMVQLNNAQNPPVSGGGELRNALVSGSSQSALTSGNVFNGITVDEDNVFQQTLCASSISISNATCIPTGTADLDDQGFFFNSLGLSSLGVGATNLNTYLVSVQIKEVANTSTSGGSALSAVTIDQAPEPSTVLLFVAGLGVIGFGRLRKRA